MKYKRKSSMMVRLTALLVVAMMFTMCFVGGTFAKYTSSATAIDRARVAKWSIKVNDDDIVTAHSFIFDLFKTINDSDLTSLEADIAPADGSIIAPGTSGKFTIAIQNLSQVNATYDIDYTVINPDNIPVEFSTNGTIWKTDIDDLDVKDVSIGLGTDTTITVQWRWAFERYTKVDTSTAPTPDENTQYYTYADGNYTAAVFPLTSFISATDYYTIEDAADTALGAGGVVPGIQVAATVTATQVD